MSHAARPAQQSTGRCYIHSWKRPVANTSSVIPVNVLRRFILQQEATRCGPPHLYRARSVHTVVQHVLEGLGRPGEALSEALPRVGQEPRKHLVDAVRVEGDV
eukprot:4999157-Alexandrium_andersonii.AAC.1